MKSTVLVVDDDSMVLFIHESVIEESILKAECRYFLSATEALEYIANETDQDMCFLIFLDINMPIMSGWQMLDCLTYHPKRKNILVTIVSSSINQTDTDKAFSYDIVVDYIAKPLKESHLEMLERDERLSDFFN